jgi:hypothetical protein
VFAVMESQCSTGMMNDGSVVLIKIDLNIVCIVAVFETLDAKKCNLCDLL